MTAKLSGWLGTVSDAECNSFCRGVVPAQRHTCQKGCASAKKFKACLATKSDDGQAEKIWCIDHLNRQFEEFISTR
jgi:hypothetical protein